jgi:hypothetical protein
MSEMVVYRENLIETLDGINEMVQKIKERIKSGENLSESQDFSLDKAYNEIIHIYTTI